MVFLCILDSIFMRFGKITITDAVQIINIILQQ